MISKDDFTTPTRWMLATAAVTIAITQAGCGGSSSSSSPTLTGLAATGAGIANGAVSAKCASGTALTGTTDTSGSYTLVLDGRTLPCMVQVSGGTPSVTLHSFAQAAGRVNITPVTDLIVARALGSDPATAFTGYTSAKGSTIEGALTTAKSYVATQISAITGSSIADPLTGTFAVGDADDKVLDALGSALTKASKTISDLRSAAQTGATLTDIVPSISTSGGGTGSASLPDALKGKVKATVYASAQSGSPYANGDLLTFTFSSSGLLMYGLTSADTSTHSTVSTFSKVGSEYVWVDTAHSRRFAVSLKTDGSFNEINVSNTDGTTFWGQFTESTTSGGGTGGTGGGGSSTTTYGSLTATNTGAAQFGTAFAPASMSSSDYFGLSWSYKWSVSATQYVDLTGSTVTIVNGAPTWQKALPPVTQLAFNAVNGTITFTDLTTTTAIGGASGPLVLNGTLNITPLNSGPVVLAGTGINYTGTGFSSPAATLAATSAAEVWTWQDTRGTNMKLTHVLTNDRYQLSFRGLGDTHYLSATDSLSALGISMDTTAKTVTLTNTAIANNNTGTTATVSGTLSLP